jgi:hypothetical protein
MTIDENITLKNTNVKRYRNYIKKMLQNKNKIKIFFGARDLNYVEYIG